MESICKACGTKVPRMKLILHIARSKGCKMKYGDEFNTLKKETRPSPLFPLQVSSSFAITVFCIEFSISRD